MLKDILSTDYKKYEEVILQSIINHRSKMITGTIYYTLREYENHMAIYQSNKEQFRSKLEALCSSMGQCIN